MGGRPKNSEGSPTPWCTLGEILLEPMNASPTSDPTREQLRSWRVAPPADPGFRTGVWARIEQTRRAVGESWSAYFRRHSVVWSVAFLVTTSGAALLGQRAGEQHTRAEHDTILHSYLAQIDARAMRP